MTISRRGLVAAGLLAAGLLATIALLAGCESAHKPATAAATTAAQRAVPVLSDLHAVSVPGARTYLGIVTGTNAFIGIAVEAGYARGYVCDGTQQQAATLADWFAGPVRDGLFAATSNQHHVRLVVRLAGQDATGTLTLAGGRSMPFTITVASPGARRAGIFAGTARWQGRTYQAAAIILPDGEQRGAAYFPRGRIIVVGLFPTGPIKAPAS